MNFVVSLWARARKCSEFGGSSEKLFDICRDQGSAPFDTVLKLSQPHGSRLLPHLGTLAPWHYQTGNSRIPHFMQGTSSLKDLVELDAEQS